MTTTPKTISHNTFRDIQVSSGVSPETMEAISKLADVLIQNAEAVKYLAANIKPGNIETGIRIG